MAFDWDHVEKIRAEQEASRVRYDSDIVPNNEVTSRVNQSVGARETNSPHLDRYEALIMKMRTQLIDYIVAHGLVDGWILDGVLQPIQNGKIVLTADTIKQITDKFGYFTEEITKEYLDKYLPENHYVSDENYVHTDNNYDDNAVAKLDGIEAGAEVNNIIDLIFNGSTVLDGDTRIATITITPENIKEWYESNPNINAFTDVDKEKLDRIESGAQVNAVEDVTIDGTTVLDPIDKTAKITKELVKTSYESNENTNAFTDAEREKLTGIAEGAEVNDVNDVTLDGESIVDKNKIAKFTAAAIKTSYESNANTNTFTDADKELVEKTVPVLSEQNHNHEKRLSELELSQHLQDDEVTKLKEKDTDLEKEITDAKDSISELGDEVNSVAGRVTTLEGSQAEQDEKINNHDKKFVDLEGSVQVISGKLDKNTKDIAELETTVNETIPEVIAEINKKDAEQDNKITDLTAAISEAGKVDDVQIDGVSVLNEDTKIANITGLAKADDIPDVSNFVPYTGATQNLDMGERSIELGDISSDNAMVSSRGFAVCHGIDTYTTIVPNRISGDKNAEEIQFIKGTGSPTTYQRISVGDPVKDSHAATKQYVDEQIAAIPSADTSNLVPYTGATKNINAGKNQIISENEVSKLAIDPYSVTITSQSDSNDFTFYRNDQIQCGKNATQFSVRGLNSDNTGNFLPMRIGEPTNEQHAATKKYVDDAISSAGGRVVTRKFFNSVAISANAEQLWRVAIKKTDGSDIPIEDLISITPIAEGTSTDATALRLTQNCTIVSPDASFTKSIIGSYVIAYKNVKDIQEFTIGIQVVAPYAVTITG